jgi:DHA1 family inner membrane transport protein
MDVALHGQALAATLMHAAFNTANALGAFLGGLAISGGYGWSSTGVVGAILALLGLAIFLAAVALDRGRHHVRGISSGPETVIGDGQRIQHVG